MHGDLHFIDFLKWKPRNAPW